MALNLATQHPQIPYPNPWVGCVIVKNGEVAGRGYHRGPGTHHAEVAALNVAGREAAGATMYVTLEPCSHYGRTPPCTDAILRAGIREVVYAVRDPNPEVSGRGAAILRRGRLKVISGICRDDARTINEVYFHYRATGLPYVAVKAATSLDGKTATRTGESKWISDRAARAMARRLRAKYQAVLVGVETVLADNPHLGPRLQGVPEPWRVILDSRLRTPPASKVIASGKCIVACTTAAPAKKRAKLEARGADVWTFRGRRVPLKPLLSRLAKRGIISLFVEGGPTALGSFFDARLVERVYWFLAPSMIGSAAARGAIDGNGASRLADAWKLSNARVEPAGKGWLIVADVRA